MSKGVKVFKDEELKARKVTVVKNNNAKSKSTYNYKKNNSSPKGQNKISKEVMVKITGNSKGLKAVKRHIDYITRDNKLTLHSDDIISYNGKEEIREYFKNFIENGSQIENELNFEGKGKREMYHITFSMNGHEKHSEQDMLKSVIKTIKEKYPNNESAFVFHGDTKNPHVHTILKVKDDEGKRLDIRKNDLTDIRKNFAKELRDLGIEAYATTRNYSNRESKNHYYEIIDFGKAKYKHSEKENVKESFFVTYKTKTGNVDIWSKDLEKVVIDSDLKIGEKAKFNIIGKTPVEVNSFQRINGRRTKVTKTVIKNEWDCSVEGREKELKKLEPVEQMNELYKFEDMKSKFSGFKKSKKIVSAEIESKAIVKKKSKFSGFKKSKKDEKGISELE